MTNNYNNVGTTSAVNDEDRPKFCRVCGDLAITINFDVLTCESCKAFFRRNALSKRKFGCSFGDGQCTIDVKQRRNCRACRLKKCLDVGMNQDLIMTEEKKVLRFSVDGKKRKNKQNDDELRPS